MNAKQRNQMQDVISRYMNGRVDRRRALQLIGGLGIAGLGAGLSGRAKISAHQDMAATPVIGPREDGTNLWKVQVGGMDMETGIDTHAFYPGEITINSGDTIYFELAPMGMPGFHTVTFTSGADLPSLFVPDIVDGTPVASPGGLPRLIYNVALLFPDGRDSYDGTGFVNSGVDALRTPDQPPYMLTFTAPGTYTYVCAVHAAVMIGTVIVQEAGSALPYDAAGYDALAKAEYAALVEHGTTTIADIGDGTSTIAPDGTTHWEIVAGAGGLSQARVMKFLPQELTIKLGDTVRWTNLSIGEPHTVTFLGGAEQPEDTIVEPQADGAPKFVQNYQTFLPDGEPTYDGNGYRNSGFLGVPPEIGGPLGLLGETYELTFTAAGEFPYYCVLHASGPEGEGGMTGKVIVEA